jgi:hypothetical protein
MVENFQLNHPLHNELSSRPKRQPGVDSFNPLNELLEPANPLDKSPQLILRHAEAR